jgi:hypothetical protein
MTKSQESATEVANRTRSGKKPIFGVASWILPGVAWLVANFVVGAATAAGRARGEWLAGLHEAIAGIFVIALCAFACVSSQLCDTSVTGGSDLPRSWRDFVLWLMVSALSFSDLGMKLKHRTSGCSQPLAVVKSTFDSMKPVSLFATLAAANGG